MATVIGYASTVFVSTPSSSSTHSTTPKFCFFKHLLKPILRRKKLLLASNIQATATAPSTDIIDINQPDERELSAKTNILACPICYNAVIQKGDTGLTIETKPRSSFECSTCKKSYYSNEIYLDLTVASGAKDYTESTPPSIEIFRTPLVSFLYERGWRQSFSLWGGFPGPDKEFELAKDYLKPVLGGNIIDASCASGLFTRLFSKSGLFSLVVALDFSESMLRQCHEFNKQEEGMPKENVILVRADIARLPFVSSSVDAVHAGAALHCWPSPSSANLVQLTSGHIFLSESELKDLCTACGLVDFTCVRNGPFIMLSATKPC
ncbi:hypothetical protein AQUCO_01000237v1 [Aquilegia coerulea]|uniref:Methyltransferase domain-containing protein n=1 Tax=Aquilegia coerulea TaxID=218851 RepID=A0A2G5E945_AQUCA|nr:hypothetical protein AQUCO_01000237v1 [Aquilegia coerulea]